MSIFKFCKNCEAETEHYTCGKCRPCSLARDQSGYQRRKAVLACIEPPAPVREPTNREGTLHGQIRGGQGCVRQSQRGGGSMG